MGAAWRPDEGTVGDWCVSPSSRCRFSLFILVVNTRAELPVPRLPPHAYFTAAWRCLPSLPGREEAGERASHTMAILELGNEQFSRSIMHMRGYEILNQDGMRWKPEGERHVDRENGDRENRGGGEACPFFTPTAIACSCRCLLMLLPRHIFSFCGWRGETETHVAR